MKLYTVGEIEDFIRYLNYCCKEGILDEETAEDIKDRGAWNEVEEMMAKGDYDANDNEKS
jgi:hypothetical protein